ncbi:MAG: hypothetical protein LBV44_07380 [Methylobacillus sp.]|nr:hypothetical protein [Methylobacillus sp.]
MKKWLLVLALGMGLAACSGGDVADAASDGAVKDTASGAASPAYPRCDEARDPCFDVAKSVNPYEVTAENHAADTLMLTVRGRVVTAHLPGVYPFGFNAIAVDASGHVFAVGGPGMRIATNDGKSNIWRIVALTGYGDYLQNVAVPGDGKAFTIGGSYNQIFRTLDGGQTWESFNKTFESRDDPEYRALKFGEGGGLGALDVVFADTQLGLVVGRASFFKGGESGEYTNYQDIGQILRTTDGGQNWAPVALPAAFDATILTRASFVDASIGWAVGNQGSVLRTADGGAHWDIVSLNDPKAKNMRLTALGFSNAQHGCVGGDYAIWCTWDGGRQWQRATTYAPESFDDSDAGDGKGIYQLVFSDERHGWAVTTQGLILASDDGGKNWKLWMDVAQASNGKLQDVQLFGLTVARGKLWAAGMTGAKPNRPPSEKMVSIGFTYRPLVLSWPTR